jgi:hypothetical protein
MITLRLATIVCAFALVTSMPAVAATATTYILPQDVHWIPLTGKGVPPGGFRANLRGTEDDTCGQLISRRFADGYTYPWHVNGVYGIYIILKGTLVLGFDKNHAKSGEKSLPAGSVLQGLESEPHYGRAIGETIFDVYVPCKK